MIEILSAPDPVLSRKADKFNFKKNSSTLPSLLREMEEALKGAKDPKGVGLAAPQVGKSISLFITKPSEKAKLRVFINPQVVKTEEPTDKKLNPKAKKIKKLEGCLSLPDIWGEVKRPPQVTLSYIDELGKKKKRKFSGFMATIVQHEVDHLEGILFPKRVLEQKGKLYKSHKNEKGEDEFEELEI